MARGPSLSSNRSRSKSKSNFGSPSILSQLGTRSQKWAGVALIAILALAAYWPSLRGGFIWDDGLLVSQSEVAHSSDGLYRIWFTTEPVDYWPVTNTSFWIEWRLWGMHTAGYHITNLLLHIADSLLVWAVLQKLKIPAHFSPPCCSRSIRSMSNRSPGLRSGKMCCRYCSVCSRRCGISNRKSGDDTIGSTSAKPRSLVLAQHRGFRAGDAQQRVRRHLAAGIFAGRLVAKGPDYPSRFDSGSAILRDCGGAHGSEHLVSSVACRRRSDPHCHIPATPLRSRCRRLVLFIQSSAAVEPDLCLSAMGDSAR